MTWSDFLDLLTTYWWVIVALVGVAFVMYFASRWFDDRERMDPRRAERPPVLESTYNVPSKGDPLAAQRIALTSLQTSLAELRADFEAHKASNAHAMDRLRQEVAGARAWQRGGRTEESQHGGFLPYDAEQTAPPRPAGSTMSPWGREPERQNSHSSYGAPPPTTPEPVRRPSEVEQHTARVLQAWREAWARGPLNQHARDELRSKLGDRITLKTDDQSKTTLEFDLDGLGSITLPLTSHSYAVPPDYDFEDTTGRRLTSSELSQLSLLDVKTPRYHRGGTTITRGLAVMGVKS